MYLDKHDTLRLKEVLEQSKVFEEDLYLIYRDEDGEINVAFGDKEISDAISED